MRPFDLKIRPIILKFQELSQDVHNSLYFLAITRNRPKRQNTLLITIFLKRKNCSNLSGGPLGGGPGPKSLFMPVVSPGPHGRALGP